MMPSRLAAAFVCLLSAGVVGCASTGATPRPFPMPDRPPEAVRTDPLGTTGIPAAIVEAALEFRGVPYRNGGSDPSGFDCSGFTQFVFARFDLSLPREVRDQYQQGRRVSREDARPGDLVFFSTVSRGASHVGIVVGGDQFVHAPSSRGVVRVESMESRYWRERFVGIRRLSPD